MPLYGIMLMVKRLLSTAVLSWVALTGCGDPQKDTTPSPQHWEPQRLPVQAVTRDHGYIRTEPLKVEGRPEDRDVRITKMRADGTVEWTRRFGGGDDDGVSSIQQTGDGGYILAGYTESFGAGSEDLWVLKLRPGGSIEWQKIFGGSDDDRARFVRQTRDLGFLVAGWSTSFIPGERDLWFLKLKPTGRVEWQTRLGLFGRSCASPFIETENGGVLPGSVNAGSTGPCAIWGMGSSAADKKTGYRISAGDGGSRLDPFHRLPFRRAMLPVGPAAGGWREETIDRRQFAGRGVLLLACVALMWLSLGADLGPGSMQATAAIFKSFSPYIRWPAVASFFIFVASTAWRIVLWLCYRPAPPRTAADPDLPAITVIIPAFNEGTTVRDSIQSVVDSDYPPDKLEVIVVDDGSTDDTYRHMEAAAAAAAPGRVSLVRLPENRGKRRAMHAGFIRTASPIAVTVDSDTVLPPDALRAIVTPLVADARIGAVAGRIEVLNRAQNVLTRMLGVRYRIGFDFQRAYQSLLGSVFVCPGALTAYRMEAIRRGLPAWLDQRFLGAPCPTGDDHALTNTVLAAGYRTVYQSNAVGMTVAPHTYRGLTKMYLRWSRSNVRESILYFGFAHRLVARGALHLAPILDAAANLVQIPLRLYLMMFGYALVALHPSLILRSLGMAIAVSMLHGIIYLRSEKSLDVVYTLAYAIFSFFTLQWIYPWATVTVRQGRWMTR